MSITVITTFSEKNWISYANRSIPTWLKFFDANTKFHFHCDRKYIDDPRITYFFSSPEKENFINRNVDKVHPMPDAPGYITRWDIYSHKVFAQYDSSKIADTDILLFLDADVACMSKFTEEDALRFLENNFCGYVGRDQPCTETGFILYNRTKDPDNSFLSEFVGQYTSDALFKLPEWDDCHIFDRCRIASNLSFKNLSGKYSSFLDPIAVGPLGEYFDHWISKKSKRTGFSKHRKFRGKV
jgi:hypothetical protein